jgi:general stress protein 26
MKMRKKIDFNEGMTYVWEKVESKKIGALATSADNRVTVRAISFIHLGDHLYFQTDSRSLKAEQLRKNRNVGVCLVNVQIEGEAEIMGHASLPVNREFVNKYKIEHPGSYKLYTNGESQIVVRIHPSLIIIWKYKEGIAFREFLWPWLRKAEREDYDVNSDGSVFNPEPLGR